MIKVLIIEDEQPARNKLKRFLADLPERIDISGEEETVSGAVNFLNKTNVDLIFSDIELLDGQAFEVFNQVSIQCPVIFTTAYDQYWMNAFESNGIEYLLKPFSKERFQKAWNKYLRLNTSQSPDKDLLTNIHKMLSQQTVNKENYQERFTITTHKGIYFIYTTDILYFSAVEGVIYAHDQSGKKHILKVETLTALEARLEPADFFRINRSELVHKKFIERIERHSKNTLSIQLKGSNWHLKTSQSQTSAFRSWLET